MFFYVVLLFSLWAEPLNTVLLEQERIPEIKGEIESLQIKIANKEKYFSNQAQIESAFWEWEILSLFSPTFIQSQLIVVQNEKMQREEQLWETEELDTSVPVNAEYLQLKNERLEYQRQELLLREQFLLRLLRRIQDDGFYNKSKHSLDLIYKNINDSVNSKDLDLVNRYSYQESRIREILKTTVVFLTVPQSTIFERILREEVGIASAVEERALVQASLERLSLLSEIVSRAELEQAILILREKEERFLIAEKKQELEEIKQEWSLDALSEQQMTDLDVRLRNQNETLDKDVPLQNIQFQINQFKLEQIQRYFERKVELESQKIEQELLASQEKLAEAKKEQEEDLELQKKIISIREMETDIRTQEATRREDFLALFKKTEEMLFEQKEKNSEVLRLPPMDSERQGSIDREFQNTQEIVRTVQEKILFLKEQALKLDMPVVEQSSMLDAKIVEAHQDLERAVQAGRKNLEDEQIVLVNLLTEVYRERDEIAKSSSIAMAEQVQDDFWREVEFEIKLSPFMTYHHWKSFSNEVNSFNWSLQSLSRYLQFWFLIALGIVLWRNLRKRITMFWNGFYSWARQQKIELVSGKSIQLSNITPEAEEHQKNIAAVLPSIVDVVTIFIAILLIHEDHFLIHLVLRGIVLWKSWKLVDPFISIWFSDGELGLRLKRGGFYLVFYSLGVGLLSFILFEMFYAYRLTELLRFFQMVLLWVLVSHQLGVWAPIILRRIEDIQGLSVLKTVIDKSSNSWFGLRIKSFFGILILIVWFLNQLLFFIAEHSQIVGRLMAKKSLRQEEVNLDVISKEEYALFSKQNSKLSILIEEKNDIEKVFAEWFEDRKRGMVAIVGRRGSGKTELLNGFLDSTRTIPIQRIVKERNNRTIVEEFEQIYSRKFSDVSELVAHLRSIESEVISIDNLHNLMFRDVSGYQDIKDILTIMQGTAHHHFWVVTCHFHAWVFLHSPAINVNLHIFREEIILKPKTFYVLQEWFLERASSLGYSVQFSEAVSRTSEEAKRRYQLAFWRVLADLSNGNPSVAELFWLESLRKGDKEKSLEMVLYSMPRTERLKSLTDTDYFVLASTLLHNGLSIEELQETLQLSFSVVQSSCRNLLGLELIYKIDNRYLIEPQWLASIEDILVTKRMIYLDV